MQLNLDRKVYAEGVKELQAKEKKLERDKKSFEERQLKLLRHSRILGFVDMCLLSLARWMICRETHHSNLLLPVFITQLCYHLNRAIENTFHLHPDENLYLVDNLRSLAKIQSQLPYLLIGET
ncbi:hypothetical protein LguiA_016861 [Lonicera macranthoides]